MNDNVIIRTEDVQKHFKGGQIKALDGVSTSIHQGEVVVVIGPSGSGKSTFLKMIAINAILAQTIHTCTASSYRGGLYKIYSSMALRDDLMAGDSYYIVEIKLHLNYHIHSLKNHLILYYIYSQQNLVY